MRALFDALSEPNEIRFEILGTPVFSITVPGCIFTAVGMSGLAATLCVLL